MNRETKDHINQLYRKLESNLQSFCLGNQQSGHLALQTMEKLKQIINQKLTKK